MSLACHISRIRQLNAHSTNDWLASMTHTVPRLKLDTETL